MSMIPEELQYTKEHEWIRNNGDGTVAIGVTDYAQQQLGDLVFLELPEVGSHYHAGDSCAVLESVKAASDVYAPLAGKVTAVNETLVDTPEIINQDPYHDGWLFTMQADDLAAETLLSAMEYAQLVADEEA